MSSLRHRGCLGADGHTGFSQGDGPVAVHGLNDGLPDATGPQGPRHCNSGAPPDHGSAYRNAAALNAKAPSRIRHEAVKTARRVPQKLTMSAHHSDPRRATKVSRGAKTARSELV